MPSKTPDVEGIFGVNKSYGITSQRAVQIVKYWARRETGNRKVKVGHAGTLDPLAEGVLVIAVGRVYTKKLDEVVATEKEYSAEVTLGATSTTDDAEGQKTVRKVAERPQRADIKRIIKEFIGDITQVPPAYSAIKIDGEEAYKRVRRGETVVMKARQVHIEDIEIIRFAYPHLEIRVTCGKGTYIRSLARALGESLGTGAYLSGLMRTRVGDFTLKDTYCLEAFEQK